MEPQRLYEIALEISQTLSSACDSVEEQCKILETVNKLLLVRNSL